MVNAQERNQKAIKMLPLLGTALLLIGLIYGIRGGLFDSSEQLSTFLTEMGTTGVLFFVLLQVVQVVVPIFPGGITLAIGVMVFGPIQGFVYNYIGILVGSALNFLLARRYGERLVLLLVSQKTYDKHINWVNEKKHFDRFFLCAILFPVAPDDLLCLLAGLTKMTFKKFMLILLFAKPLPVFLFGFGLNATVQWFLNFMA